MRHTRRLQRRSNTGSGLHPPTLHVGSHDDAAEREAERFADGFERSRSIDLASRTTGTSGPHGTTGAPLRQRMVRPSASPPDILQRQEVSSTGREPLEQRVATGAGEMSFGDGGDGARPRSTGGAAALSDIPAIARTAAIFERVRPLAGSDLTLLRQIRAAPRVYGLVLQRRAMKASLERAERRGMGIVRYTLPRRQEAMRLDQAIYEGLAELGLPDEAALMHLVHEALPDIVLRRARDLALAALAENQALAEAEMVRYADEICTPDTAGLLAADAELGQRYQDMQSTAISVDKAQTYVSSVSGGSPTTPEEYGIPEEEKSIMTVIDNLPQYRDRLTTQRAEYEEVRAGLGSRYPVLLTEGYQPGAFAQVPYDELAELTAQPLREIIDNIEEVRSAVIEDDLKVWNMRDMVAMAVGELGIGRDLVLTDAVQEHIRKQVRDQAFAKMAIAALAITATIIAGMVGGPLAAGLVGGAIGTGFLAGSIGEYRLESAAENVAMDPEVRDISIKEPQLIWIVIDVVGLGLDVGAIVRLLRPFARFALRTRRIAEFAEAARRAAPQAADRLIASLRRRLGRTAPDATSAAGHGISGAGKSLDEYVAALRAEPQAPGSVGRSWDYDHHTVGLPDNQWRPGDPIDMPSSRGGYPAYDKARQRYWRNRAHSELEARRTGEAAHKPGTTTDPVAGLSRAELESMRETGHAPQYVYPQRAGQTWELEHVGVPQRVRGWLKELGFSGSDSRRLIQESHPGSLLEVTPLEHAFFDVEAHSFGRLRADVDAARWGGTGAADVRGARPLYYMSDETIREIVQTAAAQSLNFSKNATTRALRDHLRREIAERGLGLVVP